MYVLLPIYRLRLVERKALMRRSDPMTAARLIAPRYILLEAPVLHQQCRSCRRHIRGMAIVSCKSEEQDAHADHDELSTGIPTKLPAFDIVQMHVQINYDHLRSLEILKPTSSRSPQSRVTSLPIRYAGRWQWQPEQPRHYRLVGMH